MVFAVISQMANLSSGRTRLERLIHIGVYSTFLGVDALKLAVKEAKHGKDTRRYVEAQSHLQTVGPHEPEARRDQGWIDATEKQNQAETNRLQTELNGYKHNLIKESIRVCCRSDLQGHLYGADHNVDGK
jgi:COP9 signalosome complex subunit 1